MTREHYHAMLDWAMDETKEGDYLLPLFCDKILRELSDVAKRKSQPSIEREALDALRAIAATANFSPDDMSADLGERLMDIERTARAMLAKAERKG